MKRQHILFLTIFCLFISLSSAYLEQSDYNYFQDEPDLDAPISNTPEKPPEKCVGPNCPQTSLFPLSSKNLVGIILMIFIGGLANAGGGGGGTLFTSILIMFFHYNENNAISIVYSLVFGGSLGNFINVMARRDPDTGKPLIDYDLSLICMPLMIMGTYVGVMIARMLAPAFLITGVVIVTSQSMKNIYKNAIKQYKDETTKKSMTEVMCEADQEGQPSPTTAGSLSTIDTTNYSPALKRILAQEEELFPVQKYVKLIGLILVMMLIAMLRGTHRFTSIVGLEYCSGQYWGFFLLGLLVCFISYLMNRITLQRANNLKKQFNVPQDRNSFELSSENIKILSKGSLVAGFLGGLLGIGGGLIIKPTFLTVGVPAQIMAATSGFFVVQTAFISLFYSLLFQDVPILEQAFFFIVSTAGSFGVSYLLTLLIKVTNRPSILLFSLLVVLVMSVVSTPGFVLWNNVHNLGKLFTFHNFC